MLTEAIRQVGDDFGRRKLWLPDMVVVASVMKSAMSIAEEEIKRMTTALEQKKVIESFKKADIREQVKIEAVVGGEAVTSKFVELIWADGCGPTAPGAAKLARKLIGK